MKKITKREFKSFVEEVDRILNIDTFKEILSCDEHDSVSITIETKLGLLNIILHNDVGTTVYSIYMKFHDVEKSREEVDCNPYSGKWNLHQYDKKFILEQLEQRMKFLKTF